MFQVPFLRNLFVIALVATACLPLYTLYILHPSYHQELIYETEQESARFATFLAESMGLQGVVLSRENLSTAAINQVRLVQDDSKLIKLRFFSPGGEIIYSTVPEEVGRLNEKDYFTQIVAKGNIYSKVVRKDAKTADGQVTSIDVVETYVPFLVGDQFGGAIEVYYDMTDRVVKVNQLTIRTTLTLVVVAVVLMLAISLALRNAATALRAREAAEDALRLANLDLEGRVAERTTELIKANEQLTGEIAERTLAQMALTAALEDSRVAHEKLDGILRSVFDGLLVTDGRLNVMHMNAAAEELLALPLEKGLNQPIDSLPLPADFIGRLKHCLSRQESGQTLDFEMPMEGTDSPRVYQARISYLASRDEAPDPGIVLLIHDVTRDREVERMKSAFLGMAAHELNTPLTTIIGYSEMLISDEMVKNFDQAQVNDFLGLINAKALSLSRLVDDLLDISRIESGQPLLMHHRSVCLDDLVREIVEPYRQHDHDHEFALEFPSEPVILSADQGRLQQVLENLVSNAVKYSPDGGAIRIGLGCSADACQLTVSDEGIGMTPEQVENIYDRFYRADSSDTAVQGVGLGMSVVRHIVEAHDGQIDIESQLGQGTQVTISLPRPVV